MIKLTDITIDDEFADFMPQMSDDERKDLHDSIVKDGFLDPLVVWKNHGILVDGHNRFDDWLLNFRNDPEREPDIFEKPFKDRNEVLEWMWHHQNGRRNWTDAQRVETAVKLKPVVEAKAKQNKVEAGKSKGRGKVSLKLAEPIKPIDTRKQLASMAGVSEETFRKAEAVLKSGDEETKAAMLAPKNDPKRISVNAAHKAVAPKKEKKPEPVEQPEVEPASQFDPEVIEGTKQPATDDGLKEGITERAVQIKFDLATALKSVERLMNDVDKWHAHTQINNHRAFTASYQRLHAELTQACETIIQVERAWKAGAK
jgi:ParB-like chromosome segregation protein Spo0J